MSQVMEVKTLALNALNILITLTFEV